MMKADISAIYESFSKQSNMHFPRKYLCFVMIEALEQLFKETHHASVYIVTQDSHKWCKTSQ